MRFCESENNVEMIKGFRVYSGICCSDDFFYIADRFQNIVKEIDRQGTPRVLPGLVKDTGNMDPHFSEPQGIAFIPDTENPRSGILYVCDSKSCTIKEVTLEGKVSVFAGSDCGFQNGVGTQAKFHYPTGIKYYNGDLLVCDTNNHCIRRIDANGSVSVFAGIANIQGNQNGNRLKATFTYPRSLTIDKEGNWVHNLF